ncbi:MAG: LLM class flavin-dependent oxidoreductase [Candidatus Thorarchaeota archaeon]
MRFGVQIEPQFGFEYKEVLEMSEKALENRFEVTWFSDHFMLDADAIDRTLLDPWLLMAALVRDNDKIRVGSLVFCSSYRKPSLHAKMGATIDVLSNGRFEFGIGAGWKKLEYNAYGYEFPDFYTRAEQLAEAIQIIRGAWTEDKFTFQGKHHRVQELVSFPKPVQKPHPKIWVGSNMGGPHMIELAARYGDGINVAWGFSPEQTRDIFQQLSDFAEKHSRKPESIAKSVGLWTRVLKSESEMEEKIREGAIARCISEEEYRKRVASSLWGTPEIVAERLAQYNDQGVSDIILMFPYAEIKEQIELFGEEVISLL